MKEYVKEQMVQSSYYYADGQYPNNKLLRDNAVMDYQTGYIFANTIMEAQLKSFLTHLCDTHVINLYTPDQLLTIFQKNNFGE